MDILFIQRLVLIVVSVSDAVRPKILLYNIIRHTATRSFSDTSVIKSATVPFKKELMSRKIFIQAYFILIPKL